MIVIRSAGSILWLIVTMAGISSSADPELMAQFPERRVLSESHCSDVFATLGLSRPAIPEPLTVNILIDSSRASFGYRPPSGGWLLLASAFAGYSGWSQPQRTYFLDSLGTVLWTSEISTLPSFRISENGVCAVIPSPGQNRDSACIRFIDQDGSVLGERCWDPKPFDRRGHQWWPFRSWDFLPGTDDLILVGNLYGCASLVECVDPSGVLLWEHRLPEEVVTTVELRVDSPMVRLRVCKEDYEEIFELNYSGDSLCRRSTSDRCWPTSKSNSFFHRHGIPQVWW